MGSHGIGGRPVRIGSISACSGDRQDALEKILSGPIVIDAIVGDYLAEMNLSWRKAEMEQGIGDGHDPGFLESLRRASSQLRRRFENGNFPKIVVNAGALNPRVLAEKTKTLLLDLLGETAATLKVAYITGDNVLDIVKDSRSELRHLTNPQQFLSGWEYDPIIAHAYIGQFAFVEALRAGADIVIAGRTTDAGSTQAVASWWHGWTEADFDNHALGLVAGHLIECGTYVTGGNFCGFKRLANYHDMAFPIAEIYDDGRCIITKQPDQNGVVNIDTVRSQLLYEIQGRYYFNPDVIADLSTITVSQEAEDRVLVTGFKGLPPPPTLKVAVQAYAGYQAEILVYAVGLDVEEKAQSYEIQTRKMLEATHGPVDAPKVSISLLGRCDPNPKSQAAATAVLRIFAQAKRAESLAPWKFMFPVIENLIQAYPGFTPNLEYGRTSQPKPYLGYFPCLIPREKVTMQVHFLDGQQPISVPHGSKTLTFQERKQEDYQPIDPVDLQQFGPTIKVPLGHQVLARSGDKGSNVNVGFFPQSSDEVEWQWLRSYLTTARILELLGEDAASVSRVERIELPLIHSVHFVLFDLLGGGVTDTTRHDSLGKAIAEYLRAKVVDYPQAFYRGYENRV